MTTRRGFLESLFAVGAALPALRDDALPRLARVARQADRRPVDDITRDEDFWREVQEAFTLDRTIINLNNGGVSPRSRPYGTASRRASAATRRRWRSHATQAKRSRSSSSGFRWSVATRY